MNEIFHKIEKEFNLPYGKLTERGAGRRKLKTRYHDVYLSDIRRALVYHLSSSEKVGDIARVLQLHHTSIVYLRNTGAGFIETKDERFLACLEKVKQSIE
jgi:hypothetical protein